MADLTLRYMGQTGTAAPYGDPFVIKDSWPQWQKQMWLDALTDAGYGPEKKPFVPTYEQFTVSWPGNDGQMVTMPIEQPLGIPTKATAEAIASRFAIKGVPLHILELPWIGAGPATSSAVTRLVQFPNLATLPVKQLAEYFTHAPEDQFPNVADKECRDLIARVWQG